MSEPIWLPVSNFICPSGRCPDRHAHAVAIRIGRDDQIGAVLFAPAPRQAAAPRRFPGSAIPRWGNARRSDPVPSTTSKVETEPLEHRLDDDAAGAVERREDDAQRFRGANQLLVQDQTLEPLHVGLVDLAAEDAALRRARPSGRAA